MVRFPGARRDIVLRDDLANLWASFKDNPRLVLLVVLLPIAGVVAMVGNATGGGTAWNWLVAVGLLLLPMLLVWLFYYRRPDPREDFGPPTGAPGRHQRDG